MDNYVNGVVGVFKIQNKAEAMQYAINTTLKWKCGENSKVDYDEAKKLFDFICENVEFPGDPAKKAIDELMTMANALLQPLTNEQRTSIPLWIEGSPLESVPLAVVRTCDSCYDKEVYLAKFSSDEQEWRDIYRGDVIEDVTHYLVIPHIPIN